MLNTLRVFVVNLCAIFAIFVAPPKGHSQALEWTRPLETNFASHDVSADGLGNIYISGYTSAGSLDAFVAKYDALGTLQWSRTLASPDEDWSWGVSADGLGNVYFTGHTGGSLGGTSAGFWDVFIAKYDATGNQEWVRQLGTGTSDRSHSVSADTQGNVFISGYTHGNMGAANAGDRDAFVSKYDATGNWQWTRQLGTSSEDFSWRTSTDGQGNVYMTGWTSGSLGAMNAGSDDAFLAKYDADGNLQWTRQFGSSESDRGRGVSADGLGNVFVSGWTFGSLGGSNAGSDDAFLAKYDSAGSLLWTQQFGTSGSDVSSDLMADGEGNVYVLGQSAAGLNEGSGATSAFVRKYDSAGALLWTQQLESLVSPLRAGVSADGRGNVYFSGGVSLGRVRDVLPEPSAASLMLGALATAAGRGRRQRSPEIRS